MDAMERRCQIIEILCDAKMRIKMRDLASRFNVSIRIIRTDVDVLSLTYPIQTTRGRYNGGIGFIDGYQPKNARLTPTQRDFLYVRLRYTDGQGALKPLTRGLIHVSVKGGTLLGLGNRCPYNDTGYLTSSTDTYYGEALAIVRPDGSGPVQVAAESPLGSAQTEIPWREEGNDHESYR